MSEFAAAETPPGRPRRADARRSRDAVLAAATRLFAQRPDASIEQVASAAGVARQTVYAHFGDRDGLLRAVLDALTREAAADLDDLDRPAGSAVEELAHWLDASWRIVERYPVLLSPALADLPDGDSYARHLPVLGRLSDILRRGQDEGDFDRRYPTAWLAGAVIALGHAAGEQARAAAMSVEQAGRAYRQAVLRVCRAD
jgi:AcrR family transcriptional regulator